jgi:hypothetical protein
MKGRADARRRSDHFELSFQDAAAFFPGAGLELLGAVMPAVEGVVGLLEVDKVEPCEVAEEEEPAVD